MTETTIRSLRLFPALLLVAGLAAPSAALAQDAAALLADGKKLMAEGKLAEACPKLEESQRIGPSPSTRYQVAVCHEKQGKIATAYVEFIDTEAEARKAGNKALQQDAKVRSAMLEARVPRLTVKVPKEAEVEGLEIRVNDAPLDRGSWNQPSPINPGEIKVTASAPGRKAFEKTIKLRAGGKNSVTVPALTADGAAAAPAAAPGASAEPAPGGPAPGPGAAPSPAGAAEPEPTTHQAGRFVIDVGAGPGLLIGLIDRGSLSTITSYDYTFSNRSPDGVVRDQIAVCTNEICQGVYDPSVGLLLGGQAFFGYALKDDLHLGARVFGGYRFGGGYTLVGGPSGALKVSDLWLGLTLVVGGVANDATPTAVRGEIPDEAQQFNDGQQEVDVPLENRTPLPESEVVGTFAFGAAFEVSYPLVDLPSGSWHSGALMVSAWPTVMKGLEGWAFSIPVTLGYRFY